MDESRFQFGVGVLVLAAIGVAVILTFIFGAYPVLLRKEYPITAKFPSVAGITVDTPVMKNGVRIGRVTDIELLDDGANLIMMIEEEFPLRQGEVPRIGAPKLVTGEARVEFIPATMRQQIALFDGKGTSPPDNMIQSDEAAIALKPIPKEGYFVNIDGTVASDPFSVLMEFKDEIKNTLASIETAGNSVNTLATSVQTNMESVLGKNDLPIKALAEEASGAIKDFRMTMTDVRGLLQDAEMRESLKASLDRFPVILNDAQETLQVAQRALQSFENVGNEVTATVQSVDRTVQNIEQFTEPLADNGDQLVGSVLNSFDNLDKALQQVAYFGEQLNKGDGTIKRLIEDDELYFQVRRIASNIENLTARVRPIVEDLRVAADKIARDPGGTVGARGAIRDRRPIGVGFK